MRLPAEPGADALLEEVEDGASLGPEAQRWLRRPKKEQALALRARIVLASAEGKTNIAVADAVGASRPTVGKWRKRFAERRPDGLLDEPRPGAPRKITDADVERVLALTLESKPRAATHRSTRSMAEVSGMSRSAVSRIWGAFAPQPQRAETFKQSQDPFFIEKVRDIVGLHLDPPDRAMVLCVDEKSQIQALDRTKPCYPCGRARSSGAPTTTCAMGRPRSSRRSM